MKKFAFPLSIKCASPEEKNQCIELLSSIGYIKVRETTNDEETLIVTNFNGSSVHMVAWCFKSDYEYGRYHIDHFNPELIRDVASVCKNYEWQKDEPVIRLYAVRDYQSFDGDNTLYGSIVKETVAYCRPTITDICNHYGYYIEGNDIIKNGYISNDSEHYSKYDFETYTGNNIEKNATTMLRYVEAKTGCKYSLTKTETTETKLL